MKNIPSVMIDAGGRLRTANLTTLFDGKILNADDPLLWENVGTGSGVFADNGLLMSVGAGEYFIRRGKHTCPYFSGKSQLIETTFDGFNKETDVTKRIGYFSSVAVAPFNTGFDGFFLENNGAEISIVIENDGTETARIPFESWNNYNALKDYDFDSFSVALWDFLWLGGTELRLFLKTDLGFVLAHTYEHAGNTKGTFIKSPNHSVRYDIESNGGTGSLNSICSQVATEGGFPEAGKPLVVFNQDGISTDDIGIIYALKGIKKVADFRDIAVTATRAGISSGSRNDNGIGFLLLNPTLSAPLSYDSNSRISEGTATNQTVSDIGRVLASFPSSTAGSVTGANDSILSNIPMDIENISGELVLAYMPTTSGQDVFGTLTIKEY